MSKSLKQKALYGIIWKFIETASNSIVAFIISIILARLLTPSDYGLIGMLTIFIALSSTIIDSGFSSALIQKKNRTNVDLNTVFLFNISLSCICYLILFICAPFIASFYNTPILENILRVTGLNIIIVSFNSIQNVQLQIKIDFKTTAKVSFSGMAIGGVIGITLAFLNFGVWSLVAQTLTRSIISSLVLWHSSSWRPKFIFSIRSLKNLFSFGSKLLFAGIYSITLNNIYNIIIGKVYKTQDLGIYTRANYLPDLISKTLHTVINSVTYPILSSINDDKERMINAYGKMLSMTAFFVFPVMTLLAILTKPFVIVLLTEKWIAIVPLMQWLCFARMMTPISSLNLNILNAIGRSDLFLRADLLKLPLIVANMVITLPMGIEQVAIGSTIITIIAYFINSYFPGKLFGYGAKKQIEDCKKIILAVLFMAIVTIPLFYFIQNQLLLLVIGGCVGSASYLLACYILKVKELDEIKPLLSKLKIKKS